MVVFERYHSVDIRLLMLVLNFYHLYQSILLLIKLSTLHNVVSKVTEKFFEYMQNLIEIDYLYNKLVNLTKNSFHESYKLRNVNVSYSRLLNLDVVTF